MRHSPIIGQRSVNQGRVGRFTFSFRFMMAVSSITLSDFSYNSRIVRERRTIVYFLRN